MLQQPPMLSPTSPFERRSRAAATLLLVALIAPPTPALAGERGGPAAEHPGAKRAGRHLPTESAGDRQGGAARLSRVRTPKGIWGRAKQVFGKLNVLGRRPIEGDKLSFWGRRGVEVFPTRVLEDDRGNLVMRKYTHLNGKAKVKHEIVQAHQRPDGSYDEIWEGKPEVIQTRTELGYERKDDRLQITKTIKLIEANGKFTELKYRSTIGEGDKPAYELVEGSRRVGLLKGWRFDPLKLSKLGIGPFEGGTFKPLSKGAAYRHAAVHSFPVHFLKTTAIVGAGVHFGAEAIGAHLTALETVGLALAPKLATFPAVYAWSKHKAKRKGTPKKSKNTKSALAKMEKSAVALIRGKNRREIHEAERSLEQLGVSWVGAGSARSVESAPFSEQAAAIYAEQRKKIRWPIGRTRKALEATIRHAEASGLDVPAAVTDAYRRLEQLRTTGDEPQEK